MSKITKLLKQVYEPFCAIVAYKASSDRGSDMYYLEQHRICSDGSLGAGKPLQQQTMVRIFNAVSATNKQLDCSMYGIMPDNVLYCDTRIGNERIVWYRRPEERQLYFSENLGITNGKMLVPGLVYSATKNKLQVLAFKGNRPRGRLYYAPFMNTTPEYVCLGNSKVAFPQERTFSNVIDYWETMFWQSEFSHILGENPCLGNLATITKECIMDGKPFPQDMLKPTSKKLTDLLR